MFDLKMAQFLYKNQFWFHFVNVEKKISYKLFNTIKPTIIFPTFFFQMNIEERISRFDDLNVYCNIVCIL
jgi:hypothetical protein